MTEKTLQLADYLVEHGFAGNITINEGPKNWRAIKKLIKKEDFYTFGISEINREIKAKHLTAASVRDILIEASGLDLKRFSLKSSGYFDPHKSATAIVEGLKVLRQAAIANQRLVFATGHPGAMVGLLTELANWSTSLGGNILLLDEVIPVKKPYVLDRIGPVMIPSDGCSAWHSHDTMFMQAFLRRQPVDLLVGDHGFVGEALNQNIPSIGFYDTDDPAMPLAQALGLPVRAIPLNDNKPNINSAALGRYLIEQFG
jgi:hypothetical protein